MALLCCADCSRPISRNAARCHACKVARQTMPTKICADCGVAVERRAQRCPTCAAKQRRSRSRLCEACGTASCHPQARWCWACSYALRGKRQGEPRRPCSQCGATMTQGATTRCNTCRREHKVPRRHCPDCGVRIQQHVERCRTCSGISRRVRTAADCTYGPEWDAQRRRALRTAGGICQRCTARALDGLRLHVHHIVPWRISHDSMECNLAVVCQPCHVAIHAAYRRRHCKAPAEFEVVFHELASPIPSA